MRGGNPGVRGVLLGAVALGMILGLVVAVARVVSGGGSTPTGATIDGTPTPAPEDSPAGVAARFAQLWSAGDIKALYELLDPASQALYPREAFAVAYATFASETTQSGLRAEAREASPRGFSLAVALSTRYFGVLEYEVAVGFAEGARPPRVAWSPAAIHPELGEGRVMRSELQKPQRGSILDRNGEPLAETREVRILGLNRAIVQDREAVVAAAGQVGLTRAQVERAFASPIPLNQRVAIGEVPDEHAEQAALLLRTTSGLLVYFETRRVHPLGMAAAHVVGYTRELTADELARRAGQGYSIGDRVGAVGIEAGMEEVLAGKPGGRLLVLEPGGAPAAVLAEREYVPSQDVRTTLDAAVLRAAAGRLGERAGAIVTIDPHTNEILAVNSAPAYDPDAFERNDQAAVNAILATPGDPLHNRATVGLYSAGSTFKLITGAAGLASGLFGVADRLDCTAVWTKISPSRRNWEGAQGPLTIAEGLMRSCNPVFFEIAYQLHLNADEGALSEMARDFGFGSPTGVVGFAEEDGLVPDAEWKRRVRGEDWFAGDEVNLGIGQGDLLVTPLQLANAYSSFLAGELRTPVVLAGRTAEARGAIPLTAEQKAHLQRGLELVTSARGTAAAAFANSGYTNFGGKSGTAEDAGEQQHVLFVAYAPAAGPRVVVAVVLDEGEGGSAEAGPVARDVALAALR
jgi:penicillin-binding protein 2